MRTYLTLLTLGVMWAALALGGGPAYAQPPVQYEPSSPDYGQQDYTYGPLDWALGDRELRNLVAPIALHPDPLLAIMLPASTYVDQVLEADQRGFRADDRAIERQDWDISVRALAHYPQLVRMMAQDPDWTAALGQAYVNQPQDVMDAIQYLRNRARANGVLRTTGQQRVYLEGSYIRIVPAQPRYIYIPRYDPDVVYVSQRRDRNRDLLSFGLGLIVGSWLNNDTDWQRHRVYQHGWQGRGWVQTYRRHVTVDSVYTRDRNRSVVGDHRVIGRPVNPERLRTYRLPGNQGGPPLDYRQRTRQGGNRDGARGGRGGNARGRSGDNSRDQGGRQGDRGRQRQEDSGR